MIDQILVVCEGNICRSPMAQGLMTKALPEARVNSAGINALAGRQADPIAVDLLAERGIDISEHSAVTLNLEYVRTAQIVFAMTKQQRRTIETIYPFSRGKVYCLGEHEEADIADPYRKERAAFEACLGEIERGIDRWLNVMVRLID